MQPHQQRVIDEQEQLDEKIEKLHVFIQDNPVFETLEYLDKSLLRIQLSLMRTYRDILRTRIERFNTIH